MTGGRQDGRYWATVDADRGGGISALAVQRTRRDGRCAPWSGSRLTSACPRRRSRPGAAAAALSAAGDLGFDRLLA